MILVVMALIPCLLFGIFNVGHQYYAYVDISSSPTFLDKIIVGLQSVIPIYCCFYSWWIN